MKYILIPVTFLFILFSVQCSKEQLAYELPAEMLDHVKVDYAKRCDQGKILWDLNCGGCHNIKQGRKELIPDFTADQLRGYELRVINKEHEQNLPDEQVSEEDLATIMVFLSYKKKNPAPKGVNSEQ